MVKTSKNKRKDLKPVLFVLCAFAVLAFVHYYTSFKAPILPNPSLSKLATVHRVELGVLVNPNRIENKNYSDLVSSQFSFVNIDGGAHFKEIHPTPNKYNFTKSDKIVSFAKDHNMSVQLHHLVWGDDFILPKWLTKGSFSKEQLLDILHNHITTIVKHYKGRIKEYTVVNEAFTEAQHVYGLKNWWAERIGSDSKYLDNYFIWAHQADPGAKLILNDFKDEIKNNVSDAIYNYLKAAKSRSVPIDGIGMQMHINAAQPPLKQDVVENMKRFSEIGVPVYVTEFDVNTNSVKGSSAYKSQVESQITYDMVRACIESRACVSFNVFGITSKNDLIKKITRTNSRAYIFDSRYRPRPSFYSLRQALLDQ